jgi:hypothetical protein
MAKVFVPVSVAFDAVDCLQARQHVRRFSSGGLRRSHEMTIW